MTLWKWSTTPGSNANSDSTINWAEGQAPSSVNDSARAMMAAVAKYRDDLAGTITTGGTATAYTVTTSQGFGSLANMGGKKVAFVAHTTNGATVTLNVDGLGAKPLRSASGVELSAGVIVQGTPYMATYYHPTEWILVGLANLAWSVPIGAMLDYTGATAPNSQFVLPFGQPISRTTYATYFALVGSTYGSGDGSTTFNVPDLRGRAVFGKDDMGGSAANRITSATMFPNGSTLGAIGGAEAVTILQGNIPSYTLSHTLSVSSLTITPDGNNGRIRRGSIISVSNGTGSTNNVLQDNGASTSADFSGTGTVSGSVTSNGSGNALNKLSPGIILNKILRVL
jgi:microcystin-dependent protein